MNIRKTTKADNTIVPLDAARALQIDAWLGRDEVLVAEFDGHIVGYGTGFTNGQPSLFPSR